MKVHNVPQNSPEWDALRAGTFTASRSGALLAKGKGNAPSVTRENLICEIAVERMTGKPSGGFTSTAMERGHEIEPLAREAYSFETGNTVDQLGFCVMTDDFGLELKVGCSPDGAVGDEGLVEIKSPDVHARHFANLIKNAHATEYKRQVQFQLLVTGRKWCDLVSYHPDFPPQHQLAIVRIEPDRAMHEQYREQLQLAEDEVRLRLEQLEERAA